MQAPVSKLQKEKLVGFHSNAASLEVREKLMGTVALLPRGADPVSCLPELLTGVFPLFLGFFHSCPLCLSSSLDLFPCGLLFSFTVLFRFLSLCSLYIFGRFLVCGYHEVYVYCSLSIEVYFKLIGVQVRIYSVRTTFSRPSPCFMLSMSYFRSFCGVYLLTTYCSLS